MKTCSGQRRSIYAAKRSPSQTISAVPFVALGEIVRCNYSATRSVNRWLDRMKTLKNWGKVHEVFRGFAASLKDKAFEAFETSATSAGGAGTRVDSWFFLVRLPSGVPGRPLDREPGLPEAAATRAFLELSFEAEGFFGADRRVFRARATSFFRLPGSIWKASQP